MRQVPADQNPSAESRSTVGASSEPTAQADQTRFLVIGDGRLARHISHYLTLENRPFDHWSRKSSPIFLKTFADRASHVYVCISDGAIQSFLKENLFLLNRTCVHFSGALSSPLIPSAHPLMTFSTELYPLETYRSIPFVLETGRGTRETLLPGFCNETFAIPSSAKSLYHALCAMGGNFTILLWEKVFAQFSSQLGLPRDILYPFLAQTAANLIQAPVGESVLTGPLARGDFGTIEKHLAALGSDAYAGVYRAFVDAYFKSSAPDEMTPFPLGGLL